MKLTRETDYALRIVMILTKEEGHIEAKLIAEQCDIPYRFALKILRKLVQADIAKSYRGTNGGYALNRDRKEITLLDVIEAIDGVIAINTCLENPAACQSSPECKIKQSLLRAQKVFSEELEKITFTDMLG